MIVIETEVRYSGSDISEIEIFFKKRGEIVMGKIHIYIHPGGEGICTPMCVSERKRDGLS